MKLSRQQKRKNIAHESLVTFGWRRKWIYDENEVSIWWNFSIISWTSRYEKVIVSFFIKIHAARLMSRDVHRRYICRSAKFSRKHGVVVRRNFCKPTYEHRLHEDRSRFYSIYLMLRLLDFVLGTRLVRMERRNARLSLVESFSRTNGKIDFYASQWSIFTHSTQSLHSQQHSETTFAFIILIATFNFRARLRWGGNCL